MSFANLAKVTKEPPTCDKSNPCTAVCTSAPLSLKLPTLSGWLCQIRNRFFDVCISLSFFWRLHFTRFFDVFISLETKLVLKPIKWLLSRSGCCRHARTLNLPFVRHTIKPFLIEGHTIKSSIKLILHLRDIQSNLALETHIIKTYTVYPHACRSSNEWWIKLLLKLWEREFEYLLRL